MSYDDNDATGSVVEASMIAARYIGPGNIWDQCTTAVDTGLNTATISGVTAFSDWTLGNNGTIPVELSVFTAD